MKKLSHLQIQIDVIMEQKDIVVTEESKIFLTPHFEVKGLLLSLPLFPGR